MNGNYLSVRDEWLELNREEALEPHLPIVDAHHHFYDRPGWTYLEPQFRADVSTGHLIQASVYMQALTRYRIDGPEHLRPVGETEYVVASTRSCNALPNIAMGIVAYADLRQGHAIREVLEAHEAAGEGRFRGIRHLVTWDADASLTNPLTVAPPGLLLETSYRSGLRELERNRVSYDAWLLWPQLTELMEVADSFPDLPIILNHCGGIARIGAYADKSDEVFSSWSRSIRELAKRPNVFVKLGGLGMRMNGFEFDKGSLPPTSVQLADAWSSWMLTCIDAFGPERCMFESNFPVDKGSYSYSNGWNAFKRMTRDFTQSERNHLFHGTAARVYRLT